MINESTKFEYARIKGGREWAMLKEGKMLSRKQSMLAMCYECNGFEESGVDCGAKACPIYQFHPHRGRKSGGNTPTIPPDTVELNHPDLSG